MTRRPRLLAAGLTALLAATAAGCSTIPVVGPVTEGNVDLVEPNALYLQVYGPIADAIPEQIVRGFLAAQAGGAADNFATAREFLSPEVRTVWNPNDQIMVYSGDLILDEFSGSEPPVESPETDADPEAAAGSEPKKGQPSGEPDTAVEPEERDPGPSDDTDWEADDSEPVPAESKATGEADPSGDPTGGDPEPTSPAPTEQPSVVTLVGSVGISATVDQDGRYTEAVTDATQDVIFTLVRDAAKQWRIVKAADGVLIQQPNFLTGYRSTSLYFLSPDAEFLVPEVRWYPQRNIATFAVQGLLAGPSPWLRDGVRTAVPEGTRLAINAVSVDASGVAEVDLSATVLAANAEQRALLMAQIEATLVRLTGVSSVRILATGTPLDLSVSVSPVRDPIPQSPPMGVQDGKLVEMIGRTIVPKLGTASIDGLDVTALAFGEGDGPVIVRDGTDALQYVPREGNAIVQIMAGPNILAPSVDRFGWVWSGSSDVRDELRVVRHGRTEIRVQAEWLTGLEVVSLRVSRDGTRIAIVSRNEDGEQIDVAAIMRDLTDAPVQLGTPVAVGASLISAEDVVWVDETTLAVLGQASAVTPLSVHTAPIGRHSDALTVIEGADSLAAGRGTRALYVGTKTDVLWGRSTTGTNWSQIAEGIQEFTFPG